MTSLSVKLIVGLGNPGPEYQHTRHNAGSLLVEAIADSYNLHLSKDKKLHGLTAKLSIAGHPVHLLIPSTFMNLSGKSVAAICNFYKIPPQQILVAHDELDLDPGKVRLKVGGGHGGHNGLRDIISCLGTKDFQRLRLGIGHPGDRSKVTGYVLAPPKKSEQILIQNSIDDCLQHLTAIVNGEHQSVMNKLHQNK